MHQLQSRVFERLLRDSGRYWINPARGRVLFVLWQRDGISMQELAAQTALEKSTLTRMIRRLESSGHVRRKPDRCDGRKVAVSLTEESRRMRRVYELVSARMTAVFYRGFRNDEIERFEESLQRILANLMEHEAHEPTAPRRRK